MCVVLSNFRVAVLLKYRSNAHDVVEGRYADDPGPIGSLRKLLVVVTRDKALAPRTHDTPTARGDRLWVP